MLTKDKDRDQKKYTYSLKGTKVNTQEDNILFGSEQNNYGGEMWIIYNNYVEVLHLTK